MQPIIPEQRRTAATRATVSIPSLPRLPVPDLQKTLSGYLTSLEPFLFEDAAHGGIDFKSAYDARKKVIEDFEGGLGQLCQQRLIELDKNSPHNWLNDTIWLKKAYHEWRSPLIVHSNWWLALTDDDTVPPAVRYPTGHTSGYTPWQVRRAAWLVHRTLECWYKLNLNQIYPDTTRTGLWFQHAALLCCNLCRVPQRGCDTFSPLPEPNDPSGRKVIVHISDWMYAVEAVERDGKPLPPATFEERLRAIVRDVQARRAKGERAVPVSILTTDERDRWADNLQHLLSLSPLNHAVYHTVCASIMALSLDDYMYSLPSQQQTSDRDLTAHLHNIRSGHGDRPGYNRWYDKPFTLIVENSTRAGILGEHSPVDALVPSIIADYAFVQGVDEEVFPEPLSAGENQAIAVGISLGTTEGWERLDWITDDHIAQECEGAAQRAKAIVDDSDTDELVFNTYGVDWIKNEARMAPDAYIQMALQLAWYRTRGDFTATYETALTRLFKHARTETIRTLTADSRAWVLAMGDPECPNATRVELLKRALQTHTALTRRAATGRGIDRHLLGLRLMLRPELGESHPLFEDDMFGRSQAWKLSTSGLSAGHQFRGTGFGAAYPDGYGVNYMAGGDRLRFGIESKHSCPETGTQSFKTAVTDALIDMKQLCTSTLQSHL